MIWLAALLLAVLPAGKGTLLGRLARAARLFWVVVFVLVLWGMVST